jgi:hypothetical protein
MASVLEFAGNKQHVANYSTEKTNNFLTSKLKLLEGKVKAMEKESESLTDTTALMICCSKVSNRE